MRRVFPFWLGWLLILLLPGLAHAADPPTPRNGGTLNLAIEMDPYSIDPLELWSNDAAILSFMVFQSLVDQVPGGGFAPILAQSLPSVSEDQLTYTFRLRPDVRFSNGRTMTAEDVLFSIERGCDPTLGNTSPAFFRNILGRDRFAEARMTEASQGTRANGNPSLRRLEPRTVEGLQAPDPLSFQLHLKSPDPTALTYLAAIGIVPREEVLRTDRAFRIHPVGTGPFQVQTWRRGHRIRLERNPHFPQPERVHLDAVDVLLGVDPSTQAMLFDRDEIALSSFLMDVDAWRWRKDPVTRAHLITFKGASPNFVLLNCELPPFTNRLVRQALNLAVNKEALVRISMNRAVPAHGPLPNITTAYNPEGRGYPYDPAKARALLAEAGYPDGFRSTLWCLQGDKLAFAVQQDLMAVGVATELHPVSWNALFASLSTRRVVPMGSMNAPATTEPKDYLDTLLNGENILDSNSPNMAFYSNQEVQSLLRKASVETDSVKRRRLYQQIEDRIIEDAPWIFLTHSDLELIVQPWLKGAVIHPVWPPVRLEHCWIDR